MTSNNIGAIIKAKNAKRGDRQVAALTNGFDKRESERRAENNQRRQTRRAANGSVYSDRTPFFDGTDHINLWDRGRTELGRALSMDADLNIHVHGLGKFRSFYALWVYLTTKNRSIELRMAPSYKLRQMARERKNMDNFVEPENFRYVILSALWDYVTADKALVDALIMSDEVPLVSYVEQGGMRQQHTQAKWWVPFVKLVRAQLIAGADMDLDVVRDAPGSYKDIVASFRVAESKLGRIERAPKQEATPKPVKAKDKRTKITDAAPKQEELGIKDTSTEAEPKKPRVLGYALEDLEKDFKNHSGLDLYFMIYINDPAERRRALWTGPGTTAENFGAFIDSFPKEAGGIPYENRVYFFFNAEGDCISASTDTLPNPYLGETPATEFDVNKDMTEVWGQLREINGNLIYVMLKQALATEPVSEEGTRQVLGFRGGEYRWLPINATRNGGQRRGETPVVGAISEERSVLNSTVFLGAPLSEAQAMTGEHSVIESMLTVERLAGFTEGVRTAAATDPAIQNAFFKKDNGAEDEAHDERMALAIDETPMPTEVQTVIDESSPRSINAQTESLIESFKMLEAAAAGEGTMESTDPTE